MTDRQRRKGFSLTELSVVLAVVGIVMGGIWVSAKRAWEYTKREEVVEAIATTVTNARSYFGSQSGMPALAYTAISSQLIAQNVIPKGLYRGFTAGCTNANNLCADHPWRNSVNGVLDPAGTFRVCNWPWNTAPIHSDCATAPAAISPFFGVGLTGLSVGACIALVQRVSAPSGPPGLVEVSINGVNVFAAGNAVQPVPDDVATAKCQLNANGTETVTFVYGVRAPSP